MFSDESYGRYMYFYTNFAFKRLFGSEMNKDLLISFLNALLHGREHICDLTYLSTEHLGTQEYNRRAVFDAYCKNENGEHFLVEIQKGEQPIFEERSLYYSTFAIREQAPRGEWDYELKGIYIIGIMNFCIFRNDPDFYHEVKLMDVKTKEVFNDKFTFIYLEMPKFNKTEDELDGMFEKWLYAIRNLDSLMERPRALQEKVFTRLFEAAEIARFDRQSRFEYEESLKAFRDWYSVMKTAENKGLARGMEQGLKQGLERGKAAGMKQARVELVRQMKAGGLSVELIAKLTGLSAEEIAGIS